MEWLPVIDYPDYFINEKLQVKRNSFLFKDRRNVCLYSKDRPKYAINRLRLFYLTKQGISPLAAKGKDVEIFKRNGVVHIEDRSTRRQQMAQAQHSQPKRSKEEAVMLLEENIRRCRAMIAALDGDTADFLQEIELIRPRLQKHIARKYAIKQKDIVEDVVAECLLWYINAVTKQHTTASSFQYIAKRAEGIYKDWLKLFKNKKIVV